MNVLVHLLLCFDDIIVVCATTQAASSLIDTI